MEYLRQIEDDLKNIGTESKNKFPLVKEAADKALNALKIIRDTYVSDIMKRSNDEKSVKFPQSSDILSPFMLACNYADCTSKLINMALNGIHMLLNYGMIPPGDIKNILRVLSIQASAPKFDLQLKLLQIVLHMANSLSHDADSAQYLTESTICSFVTLSLQVYDGKGNASVTNTALGTVRQLIGLVLDGALSVFNLKGPAGDVAAEHKESPVAVTIDQSSSSFSISATLLLRDLALFIQGLPGDWIRGVTIPQSFALDLMYELLHGWRVLFVRVGSFKVLLRESVCPAIRPLLRCLQEDFLSAAARHGLTVASAFTSRVVRIARCLLLEHCSPELFDEAEFVLTLLVHSLQPDRGLNGPNELSLQTPTNHFAERGSRGMSSPKGGAAEDPTFRSRFEDPANLMSRLAAPMSMAAGAINNFKQGGGAAQSRPNLASLSAIPGLFIPLFSGSGAPLNAGPQSGATLLASQPSPNGNSQIPAHPAALCLETLLSFLACGRQCSQLGEEGGLRLLETLLVNVSVSVAGLLQSALSVESNAR